MRTYSASRPLTKPTSVAATSAITRLGASGTPMVCTPTTAMIPASAMMAPCEMSMPPQIRTIVAPMAAMASTDDWRRMFMTLASVMKAGDRIAKKTIRSTSSASGTP